MVLVHKHGGRLHQCVDYCALNAKTHKDTYLLLHIQKALDALQGAKYFCSLDLAHGYHQIPVTEDVIEKIAFYLATIGCTKAPKCPSADAMLLQCSCD